MPDKSKPTAAALLQYDPGSTVFGDVAMAIRLTVPVIPASFFGMVLGLSGLGGAWRAAH
jgi:hypothetical protein